MNAPQKAMIYKDMNEVFRSKQTLIPMIIVPLVMAFFLPLGLMIGAQYGVSGLNGMDAMMKVLPIQFSELSNAQILIEIALNYMFPVFFLLIPVMASSIIGASSFVGEKEHQTMESLLYTPITIREIFVAKIIGTAIPAYAVTLISVIVFGLVMDIGGWFYFQNIIFPNTKWLILMIWVVPAITLLSINFIVLVSAKAHTFQEAQQMSAFIIIPILLLLFGQMTGLFLLSNSVLFIVGAGVFVLDYFLMANATKKFIPEKLI